MFIVLEIQKLSENQVSTLVNAYSSQNEAFQKYHMILSYAAVSEVMVHSAVILTEEGFLISQQSFDHREPVQAEE